MSELTTDNWVLSCVPNADGICRVHGGEALQPYETCPTVTVLLSVRDERISQIERYGDNADLELGTGPRTEWLSPIAAYDAVTVEQMFREHYVAHERRAGKPTWMHLIREELAEAFMEDDPGRLEEEITQVAALCVSLATRLRAGR